MVKQMSNLNAIVLSKQAIPMRQAIEKQQNSPDIQMNSPNTSLFIRLKYFFSFFLHTILLCITECIIATYMKLFYILLYCANTILIVKDVKQFNNFANKGT